MAQKSMFYISISTEKNVELSIVNRKKLMLMSDKLLISLVAIFQTLVTKSGVLSYKSGFGKPSSPFRIEYLRVSCGCLRIFIFLCIKL